MKMICALAFVPSKSLKIEFKNLMTYFLNIKANDNIIHLLLWVDDNLFNNSIYIHASSTEHFKYIFSVFDNTTLGLPRN